MEIRPVRPVESASVADLTLRGYVDAGYVAPGSPYVAALLDVDGRMRDAEVWVAVDGASIVGAVTWCPDGSCWREIAADHEGEFRMLVVDPAARGRGVGEALVRHCLRLSREAGHRGMALSTMARMTDAHRLYGRLGFRRDPAADWSPAPGVNLLAFRLEH